MAAQPTQPWESDDALEGELSNKPERRSDERLIARARSGDDSAFAALYRRHVDSARRFARYWVVPPTDPDDVVSEAFTRVLGVIRAGRGPSHCFRTYVLTVVRRVAANDARRGKRATATADLEEFAAPIPFEDPVVKELEGSMVARAFATLPERWQTVLWHTEVEGENPAQVAPHLGLSPNGAAALAYRAREGLRTAYVQEHLSADGIEGECRGCASKLASYHRGTVGARARRRIEDHLAECDRCRLLLVELGEVSGGLRGVLGPVLLGPAVAGLRATTSGSSGAQSAGRARDALGRLAGAGDDGFSVGRAVVVMSLVAGCVVIVSGTFFLLSDSPSGSSSRAVGAPAPSASAVASPSPAPAPRRPGSPAPADTAPADTAPTALPGAATVRAPHPPTPDAGRPAAPSSSSTPSTGPTSHPQPALQDGDFEEPPAGASHTTVYAGQTIGGWTVAQNSVDLVSDHEWQAAEGHQSIDLNGSDPGPLAGAIAQRFDTVAGQPYTVTFALAGNPSCAPAVKTLEVEVGGAAQGFSFDTTGHSVSGMGWRPERVRFTAAGDKTTLRFVSTTDTKSLCGPAIDNVHVSVG